jgi:hypothetical protein
MIEIKGFVSPQVDSDGGLLNPIAALYNAGKTVKGELHAKVESVVH